VQKHRKNKASARADLQQLMDTCDAKNRYASGSLRGLLQRA
jgi:hypothetical protein